MRLLPQCLLTKTVLGLACITFFSFSALAANDQKHAIAPEREYQRYDSPDGRFSVALPANWEQSVRSNGTVIQASRPKENNPQDAMREYMMIGSIEIGDKVTLPEYVQVTMHGFKQLNPAVEIMSQEKLEIDGLEAIKVIYTSIAPNNQPFKSSQAFLVKDGRGYYVAGMTPIDTFDKYAPIFDKVAQSFKMKG